MSEMFHVGDLVVYQYGQVRFAGTIIARGRALDVVTKEPLQDNDGFRYIVQQMGTGILHVYGPRHLTRGYATPSDSA
jgi:hypothetical protein